MEENNKEKVAEELLELLENFFDLELIVFAICDIWNDPNFPKKTKWVQHIFSAFQLYLKLEKK